jgi:hypothetical protein
MKQLYFPGTSKQGGEGGILVKVIPETGEEWIATFAGGYSSPRVVSGIFTTPDPRSLCVVSAGRGYVVRADAPQLWEEVRTFPIIDVHSVTEKNLLIFADYTTLEAYGTAGTVWKTSRLSWDGLRITQITDEVIYGLARDPQEDKEVEFSVSLTTGVHQDGSISET